MALVVWEHTLMSPTSSGTDRIHIVVPVSPVEGTVHRRTMILVPGYFVVMRVENVCGIQVLDMPDHGVKIG